MAATELRVAIVLTNPKAMEALTEAAEGLDELIEDLPWREDAKDVKRALQYAVQYLDPRKVL